HGSNGETPPTRDHGSDRRRRGSNHIDGHNGVVVKVIAIAGRKAIDHDSHGSGRLLDGSVLNSWPQLGGGKGIRVQSPAVDLYAKELFQAHVAQMNFRTKVIEKTELAGLVRSLEQDNVESECGCEAIGKV